MQKHIMIGINDFNRCGLLGCLMDFDAVKTVALCDTDLIVPDDFTYIATGWGGCNTLESVLAGKGLELTGDEIVLANPLIFRGTDHDHGHESSWTVTITRILKVEVI